MIVSEVSVKNNFIDQYRRTNYIFNNKSSSLSTYLPMVSKDYANNENYGRVPDNKAPGQYNTPRDARETRKHSQTDDRSAQPEQ